MKQFNEGKKMAKKILMEFLGKKEAKALWNNIRWSFSPAVPKGIECEKGFQWMGLCCPMTDGTNSIIINPNHHKDAEEIALTIGHELAHALQNVTKGAGNANHEDAIFMEFANVYSAMLGFELESF